VRSSLERAINDGTGAAYPEPIEHCDICRWRRDCDNRRRRDDHLSLVAGISKSQIGELTRSGVGSTAALSAMPIPLEWRPERGVAKSYEKIREQARIQVEGRTSGSMKFEALPPIAGCGRKLTFAENPFEVLWLVSHMKPMSEAAIVDPFHFDIAAFL
jgi:uncharacterized protein